MTGGRQSEVNKHVIADRYAVAAGLVDARLNEDGEEEGKVFNCDCYLERYPEVVDNWAYDEPGVVAYGLMWPTRHNRKKVKRYYDNSGMRLGHDPSCSYEAYALREAAKRFLFTL